MNSGPSLKSLFARPASLPVVPKVAQQLMRSLSQGSVSIHQIASQLAADPVLSAKTLRLANSACFQSPRNFDTVDDAVLMLGFRMVRNLVMGCSVIGSFKSAPGLDLPSFWRYCLNTACAARWLARAADDDSDLAFTIGLVHGLGHLVMHGAMSAQMQQLDLTVHPLAPGRATAERELLGFDHAEVSAELALCWSFPVEVADALRDVPRPLRENPPLPMAAWVHVAAWRSRVDLFGWDAEQALATCPREVGEAMGRPFTWLAEQFTMGGLDPDVMPPMPPLEQLTEGLESMLA
jgi:HD-like signal output (HDOD) protein